MHDDPIQWDEPSYSTGWRRWVHDIVTAISCSSWVVAWLLVSTVTWGWAHWVAYLVVVSSFTMLGLVAFGTDPQRR